MGFVSTFIIGKWIEIIPSSFILFIYLFYLFFFQPEKIRLIHENHLKMLSGIFSEK